MIKLVEVDLNHKDDLLDYKNEFIVENETIHGSAGLDRFDNFEEYFQKILDAKNKETLPDNYVVSTTYLCYDKQILVGMISIRHYLNDYLIKFGGHIGYSVRKSYRNLGYASKMLKIALNKAKELGLTKVLITCDKENIASSRVIIKNGGILENEVMEGNKITLRYWIGI